MPARDGSGPKGMGSLTGRGMGNCKTARPTYGLGRGFRRGSIYAASCGMSLEEEHAWLKSRLDANKTEIDTTKEK